jgi:hypothetical protein
MSKFKVIAAAVLLAFTAAAASQAPALAAAETAAFNPRDLTGVWFQSGGGKFPEYQFTPEYAAIRAQRIKAMADGNPYQPSGSSCLPRGLVGMLTSGAYPLEIFQTERGVTILKENGGVHRIRLDRKHLSEDDLTPLFFGDSVGWWEGDMLVVDSISLGATDNIDGQAPHSDAMHVVQKFRRTGPASLEAEVMVEDVKALLQPVTTKVTYRLDNTYELQEYYCVNERRGANPNGGVASK